MLCRANQLDCLPNLSHHIKPEKSVNRIQMKNTAVNHREVIQVSVTTGGGIFERTIKLGGKKNRTVLIGKTSAVMEMMLNF